MKTTEDKTALISSPGNDGGQEVEAAEWQGRYWIEDENRWSNWITNPVGYPWAYDPQEGKSEIRYLYTKTASTALVERLTKALEPFARFAENVTYQQGEFADSFIWLSGIHRESISTWFGPTDFGVAFEALSASQSTSREGER